MAPSGNTWAAHSRDVPPPPPPVKVRCRFTDVHGWEAKKGELAPFYPAPDLGAEAPMGPSYCHPDPAVPQI